MAESRRFRRNLGVKLTALGLGLLVWILLSVEPRVERALEAGVSYMNIPASLELNPDQVDRVTLILRGPRRRVQLAERSELDVVIDLAGCREGTEQTFDITESHVELPDGVRLVRSIPSQVRLALELRAEQEVTVYPNLTGTPGGGREVAAVQLEPPLLTIEGPATRVRLVQQVTTDPIDLSGISGAESFRTRAYLPDPYLRFQGNSTVIVHVRLE